MRLINNFFFIVVILLLSINNLKAEDKVAYLDIDYILTNTLAGKSLLKSLKQNEEIKISKFKSSDENFKNEEKKILAKKKLISNEQLRNELKQLQIKFQDYQKKKNKELEILKKKRNTNIINFINLINPKSLMLLLVIGLLLFCSTLIIQYGLPKINPVKASPIFTFEIVVAALSSYWLANEILGVKDLVGGVFIILAISLSALK